MLTLDQSVGRNEIIARNESANEKFPTRRSSCLLFQMFSVETYSFLPNQQSDGSDLACQRKSRHRGFYSSRQTRFIEILERSGCRRSQGGRSFEDVFQIMVMVAVQSADGQGLFGSFELASYETILTTGVGL